MKIPKHKAVTVQDLAALANVSAATVSRVLSQPEKVSAKTKNLVMKAVEETGYTLNQAARSLRRQQTDTIVILVPNIGNSVFSNVIEGIEKVCAQNNISVLIADTQKASMSPLKARSYFSQNKVDGVIIMDGLMPLDVLNLGQNSPPIVYAGEWNPDADFPVVRIDDSYGVKLAVTHLYELGHRRFGHVAGPLFHVPGKLRYDSFCQSLSQLNCEPQQAWLFEGQFSLASGKSAAQAWFALPESQRPSAVFCAGDEIAFGFMSALNQLNIRVPQDVSVVGYDDLQVAEYYIPPLTTVHQPRRALGALAASTLLALIQHTPLEPPEPIKPWLKVRASTAKVAG